MSIPRLILSSIIVLVLAGCSTQTFIKLPKDTTISVNDKGHQFSQGLVKTRPFFWNRAGGVPYKLMNADNEVIDEGKLRTKFRVSSIFWPPYAVIYWPLGFGSGCFNLEEQDSSPEYCTRKEHRDLRIEYRENRRAR